MLYLLCKGNLWKYKISIKSSWSKWSLLYIRWKNTDYSSLVSYVLSLYNSNQTFIVFDSSHWIVSLPWSVSNMTCFVFLKAALLFGSQYGFWEFWIRCHVDIALKSTHPEIKWMAGILYQGVKGVGAWK